MLVIHPHIHNEEKSFYPFPLNHIMQDYDGHVLCHHVTGLCMSSVPHTGYAHDVLLFLHGLLYKFGVVNRLTFGETVLNYSLHVVLGVLAWGYLWFVYAGMNWVQRLLGVGGEKGGEKKTKIA